MESSSISPIQHLLSHCYFSSFCRSLYLLLILSTLLCILWTLFLLCSLPSSPLFRVLETCISLSVLLEVLFRVYLIGWRRFVSIGNSCDMLVAVISVGVILDGVWENVGVEALIGDLWVVLRVIVLYLRLAVLVKNRKETDIEGISFVEERRTGEEVEMSEDLEEDVK
jgi:hypothetical protein